MEGALAARIRDGSADWKDVIAEIRSDRGLGLAQVRSALLLAELKLKPPTSREAEARGRALRYRLQTPPMFYSRVGVGLALILVCVALQPGSL
jgi:hypothetical protein